MKDKDFIELVENNKRRIYRLCKVNSTETFPPEDLFQEIVYNIWKSLDNFKGKSEVSTWIYRIALNVCYGSISKHKRKNEKFIRLENVKIHGIDDSVNEEDKIKVNALNECISQLDKPDQTVIILFLEELSYREISEIIGISENYVAVKMKRIRKKLEKCLTPKIKDHEG